MASAKALSILKPLTSYTAQPKLPKYKPMGSAKAPSPLTVNSSNSLCAVRSQLPKYKSMASTNTCYVQGEDEKLSSEIPVISLAGMDEVDGKREEICKKIVEACEDWGVFQLVDHGVETRLISEMTRLATDFFALPAEDKLRFDTTGGKRGGFTVLNNLQGEVGQNWREIVTYFAYPIQKRDYSRWPDSPEGWIKVTEQFSEQLMGLACKILGVLSEAMGLEAEAMKKACIDIDQKLMLNYYPKCPQPELTPGIKRHTDAGTITILLQDRVGGLQITRDDANTWIQVPAIEGAFVVSLGDHGHLLSNGRFKNADHQAEVKSSNGRLSTVAYMNPTPEATVYPLAVREGEPPILEEPITFAEMYRRKVGKDIELSSLKNG